MPYRHTLRNDLNRKNMDGILYLLKIVGLELYPSFSTVAFFFKSFVDLLHKLSEEWRWWVKSRGRRLCDGVTASSSWIIYLSHRNEIKIKYEGKGQFTRWFEIGSSFPFSFRVISGPLFFSFSRLYTKVGTINTSCIYNSRTIRYTISRFSRSPFFDLSLFPRLSLFLFVVFFFQFNLPW
jgi:hypothetical protein